MNIAVIFAGGSGVRMGAGIPKQFLEINGKPVIVYTLQLFQYHEEIDEIYLAIVDEYIDYMKELIEDYRLTKVKCVMPGGQTAQDSIYNALKQIQSDKAGTPEANPIVLIHDGVRPFVSYDVINRNIDGVKEFGNAITATPCFETIIESHDGDMVEHVPYRKDTFAAQAPQSFYLEDIIAAHDRVRALPSRYDDLVDACTIMDSQGLKTHLVEGNRGNIKVTTPEDVYMFRALLQYEENEQSFGLGLTNRINSRIRRSRRSEENR